MFFQKIADVINRILKNITYTIIPSNIRGKIAVMPGLNVYWFCCCSRQLDTIFVGQYLTYSKWLNQL